MELSGHRQGPKCVLRREMKQGQELEDGSAGKESTCNVGDLGWEDSLEKG